MLWCWTSSKPCHDVLADGDRGVYFGRGRSHGVRNLAFKIKDPTSTLHSSHDEAYVSQQRHEVSTSPIGGKTG